MPFQMQTVYPVRLCNLKHIHKPLILALALGLMWTMTWTERSKTLYMQKHLSILDLKGVCGVERYLGGGQERMALSTDRQKVVASSGKLKKNPKQIIQIEKDSWERHWEIHSDCLCN